MKNFQEVIIITDVKWRKSLAAIRALGKNKHNFIIAVGNSILDMGLWSTYVNKKVVFPCLKNNYEKYLDKLKRLINLCLTKYHMKPIILTMEEETLGLLIQNIDIKNNCKSLIPNAGSYSVANNKFMALAHADSLGIDTPYTCNFDTVDELIRFLQMHPDKEWVVKPLVGKGSFGLLYISGNFDITQVRRNWDLFGKLIVQDRIPIDGESVCVGMIFSNTHELVDYFVYLRIRTYPITGGPSTSRISISNIDLVTKSYRIMQALQWSGVVMVEWKKDTRDNLFKLIEINPRFWGGLELGIRSGVNFPQLYADLSSGKEVVSHHVYSINVVSRWVIPGDILWLLSQKHKSFKDYKIFLHHILKDADEWDKTDIPGSIATVICQLMQVCNPRNWRFLKR